MSPSIPAFPLCWPDRFPRSKTRMSSPFKTSLPSAIKNVQDSLRRFAADSGKKLDGLTISSNVTLGVNNPNDPGVAVWFTWDGLNVCIAVDRYQRLEANLQAIHHILEARRTELRHGGLEIIRATFAGFLALPAPAARPWWVVMNLTNAATADEINARFKELAKTAHPDKGGSADAFAELIKARDAGLTERGAL